MPPYALIINELQLRRYCVKLRTNLRKLHKRLRSECLHLENNGIKKPLVRRYVVRNYWCYLLQFHISSPLVFLKHFPEILTAQAVIKLPVSEIQPDANFAGFLTGKRIW